MPMSSCTGWEIMTELLGHLQIEADAAKILGNCTCIRCMMPFITSQFFPSGKGESPTGRAGRLKEPCLYWAILRITRGCGLRRRVFETVRADGSLPLAGVEAYAAFCLQRSARCSRFA